MSAGNGGDSSPYERNSREYCISWRPQATALDAVDVPMSESVSFCDCSTKGGMRGISACSILWAALCPSGTSFAARDGEGIPLQNTGLIALLHAPCRRCSTGRSRVARLAPAMPAYPLERRCIVGYPSRFDCVLETRGKANREIGEILAISPRTVNKHLEQIFVKLGVGNRASAAARAVRALSR
jgi:hypothetical protein